MRDAHRFLEDGEKMQLSYAVQNTHRTVGTRTSSHIVKKFGMRNTLQPDHLTVKLSGSAGQSLGAFAAPGLKLEVSGDANDYVGKGLSGGTIVVRPPMASPIVPSENRRSTDWAEAWGAGPCSGSSRRRASSRFSATGPSAAEPDDGWHEDPE